MYAVSGLGSWCRAHSNHIFSPPENEKTAGWGRAGQAATASTSGMCSPACLHYLSPLRARVFCRLEGRSRPFLAFISGQPVQVTRRTLATPGWACAGQ